jgi:hypothetical protein
MGYFKRRIDRGRARALLRRLDALHQADQEMGARPAWEAIPDEPPKRCFIRFSVAARHPASGRRQGIFSAVHELLDDPAIDAETERALRDAMRWFNVLLPSPELEEEAAIFLFKSDAGECTRRIWTFVRILGEHGRFCEMQRSERPGRIVYEDEFQVAVVPWKSAGSL